MDTMVPYDRNPLCELSRNRTLFDLIINFNEKWFIPKTVFSYNFKTAFLRFKQFSPLHFQFHSLAKKSIDLTLDITRHLNFTRCRQWNMTFVDFFVYYMMTKKIIWIILKNTLVRKTLCDWQ